MPQETLFSNLKEGNGGGGHVRLKKIKISSRSEKICTFFFSSFKQLNYCTLDPNILSLARNIPVQHPEDLHQTHPANNNTFLFLEHVDSDSLKKGFKDWPQQARTTVTADPSVQTHTQPGVCSECCTRRKKEMRRRFDNIVGPTRRRTGRPFQPR